MTDDQHKFTDRYMIRMPDGLRDRIKAAAAKNGRSMNAEVVSVLADAFGNHGASIPVTPEHFVALHRIATWAVDRCPGARVTRIDPDGITFLIPVPAP